MFCVVALVGLHGGGRCLGRVLDSRILFSNRRSMEQNDVKRGGESLTPGADAAKHMVDDFLQKIKRIGKIDDSVTADKCGYEVCINCN